MTETFQLTLEQAKAYDDLFVPALFGQWAPQLVSCARVASGQRVLDVACGTGAVARTAVDTVGPQGRVVGVDLNPAMLEVARSSRPDLEWFQGDAEDLPFETDSFDAALCQSALFFFPEPFRAVREMARVVGPGGIVAIQTYAALPEQPAYGPFMDVVARHAGQEARILLGTYWSQGDLSKLTDYRRGRAGSTRDPHQPGRRTVPVDGCGGAHRDPRYSAGRPARPCHLRPDPRGLARVAEQVRRGRRHSPGPDPGNDDRGRKTSAS